MSELVQNIDRELAALAPQGVPGCAIGVVLEGETVYARGAGIANLSCGLPVTTNTAFYAASLAKQFTGCCIALLRERGAVDITDEVGVYLPELPTYEYPVTIAHLLSHTSGLPDYIQLFFALGFHDNRELDHITDREVFDLLLRQDRLEFPPGSEFRYTNTGYFLLARVIETVAGCSFREFAEREIFQPLGMDRTAFLQHAGEVVPEVAVGYRRIGQDGFREYTTGNSIGGASGMVTTINDLCAWAVNLVQPAIGKRPQELVDLMFRSGVLADGSPCGYGFGFQIDVHAGLKHVNHVGNFGALTSVIHHFPERSLSVVGLTNRDGLDVTQVALRIADGFLQGEPVSLGTVSVQGEKRQAPVAEFDRTLAGRYAGIYRSVRTRRVAMFDAEDGDLLFCVPGKICDKHIYRPLSENRFTLAVRGTGDVLPSPEIEFTSRSDGSDEIEVQFVYGPDFKSRYRRFTPALLSEADLESYAGAYYCRSLDVVVICAQRRKGLRCGCRPSGV